MSERGSRPKISSGRLTSPAALPSSVLTFSSMSRALLLGCIGNVRLCGRRRRSLVLTELAGLRSLLRQRLLDGVAHGDPAGLAARHRSFHQDKAALDVRLHHLEIERGHAIDAHMPGHLLVLEGLARVLAAAGGTDRAVRDRHAVGGAQAYEIPPLHAASNDLAVRRAGDVDE